VRFGAPDLVAAGQTAKGVDPVTLRYSGLTSKGARLRMQEEQSHDRETRHGGERVGWVVIGKL